VTSFDNGLNYFENRNVISSIFDEYAEYGRALKDSNGILKILKKNEAAAAFAAPGCSRIEYVDVVVMHFSVFFIYKLKPVSCHTPDVCHIPMDAPWSDARDGGVRDGRLCLVREWDGV